MATKVFSHKTHIERDIMAAAVRAPMLEKDHELDLARRWQDAGDKKALDELTRSYLRLVISVARRFRNYGLAFNDLVQEGTIGLMEAAMRFEPSRDIRFSTYAGWWIRSSIQDYVLRNWSIVRTGTTAAHKSLFFNFRRLRARIEGHTNTHLSLKGRKAVAKELGVRLIDVETMESRLTNHDHSLNAPIVSEDGSSTEWQDNLVDDRPHPEASVMENHDSAVHSSLIFNALDHLDEREKKIIEERRLHESGVTLANLGHQLGISKERVRQIEIVALSKLRRAIVEQLGGERMCDVSALI